MKLKLKFSLLTTMAILMVACSGNNSQKDIKSMREDVMAVHDEVMPKMGELRKMEKSLQQKAAELLLADSTMDVSSYTAAANEIASANEAMMGWMRAYEPNFEGSNEEIAAYLEAQKKSIDQVKQDMLGSLEAGKALLAE